MLEDSWEHWEAEHGEFISPKGDWQAQKAALEYGEIFRKLYQADAGRGTQRGAKKEAINRVTKF